MSRPSSYTDATGTVICDQLALGRSLRSICDGDDMPGQTTVFRWLEDNPQFRERYARAREIQADTLVDQTLDIADDGTNDWMEEFDKKTGVSIGWKINGEAVQRSRLRCEQRRWSAGKLAPKKYGEKLALEHSGPGGGPIEHHVMQMTDEELDRMILQAPARAALEGEVEGDGE